MLRVRDLAHDVVACSGVVCVAMGVVALPSSVAVSATGSGGECTQALHCNDGNSCTEDTCPIREVEPDGRPADFSNSGVAGVLSIDVDDDGDLDVVSTSRHGSGQERVTWMENDGAGAFVGHIVAIDNGDVFSVFAADVDSDGDVDLLAGWRSKIMWYENDGAENFTANFVESGIGRVRSLTATDLDQDGDMDVVASSHDSRVGPDDDRIMWYENDGIENFIPHTIATDALDPWGISVADIDADGDTDVLSASRDDTKVAWYENDGSENFSAHAITTNLDDAAVLHVADIDGDADVDVLASSLFSGDERLEWYENDGTGTFLIHVVDASSNGARALSVEDIDGDGDGDLIVVENSRPLQWYENDGSENFTLRVVTDSIPDGQSRVFPVDFDFDGDVDLLSDARFEGLLAWWENDGTEGFARHLIPTPFNLGSVESVHATDVDGDGDQDVVSGSVQTSSGLQVTVAWYENDGSATFTKHVVLVAHAHSVVGTDMDDDGDVDILFGYNGVGWLENDGSESFTHHELPADPDVQYRSVSAVDIDSDGDADVLAASARGPIGVGDTVEWLENDGAENFTRHVITSRIDASYFWAHGVDVDEDGDVDVVSAAWSLGEVSWYENDGGESFTEHIVTTAAAGANAVSAADLDGDGDVDLLSASRKTVPLNEDWDDDKIAWYENDGLENFKQHIIAGDINDSTQKGLGVVAVDLDHDGDIDVLPASRSNLEWYENDGSGKFTTRAIAGSIGGESVIPADLDGDADTDLVYGTANKIFWYENIPVASSVPGFRRCQNEAIVGCDCGNGVEEGDEACDDGNQLNGDGCSADCQDEVALTNADQKCVGGLNKAATKIATKQGKQNTKCVANAARGRLLTLTAQRCLTERAREQVSKALASAATIEVRQCAGFYNAATAPDFGSAGSVAVQHATWSHTVALAADTFGADLDAAIIDRSLDKVGATCQKTVAKWSGKLLKERLRAFTNCKVAGLRDVIIDSGSALRDDCLPATIDDDRVTNTAGKLTEKVTKKCSGVDVATAFPGRCVATSDLPTCVDEMVECRACLMLSAMDGFTADCDAFDDGLSNVSCPPN